MPNKNAADLDRLYRAADSTDDKLFSEMRSNVLLVSGDHYNRRGSKFWNRIRSSKEITDHQKLRLTKNHVQKICNVYAGNIVADTPNALPTPNNPDEIQDQKTAELNKSVWDHTKKQLKFRQKVRTFADNLIQFGECHAKVFWDANKGEIVGYAQLEVDGEPQYGEDGSETANENAPIYSGQLSVEEVYAFNLLRDPSAQSLFESPYYIVRKMADKKDVKMMVKSEEEWKKICDDSEESYLVFDGDKSNYEVEKSKIMIREHYYKPCMTYPNGYFYICTRDIILAEGELPFGIWPFASAGFNKIPTSPRYRSPIKQMRPYQIEINRAASAIATAQVTLGDDKLIMLNGSKMSMNSKLPGVRGINVTSGMAPTILPGRGGEQYLPYMQSQIDELYKVMEVYDDVDDNAQFDAYATLYKSARNKKKFRKYREEFEEFVCEICEISLKLMRHYLEEYHLVPMIGKSEYVNIQEFKHSEPNRYRIKIEAVSDDIDTMLGKQISINHTLQYVGKTLDKTDIGRMVKAMPFMNYDESFGDLTIDYDMSKNDMLAMERGEQPQVHKNSNHPYLIKQAINRTKKADFRFLPPQVQQLYQMYIQQLQQMESMVQQEALRAQQGLIPTGGALVTVDYYRTNDEGKTKRAKLPYETLQWIEKQLNAQGVNLDRLEEMDEQTRSEILQQAMQGLQNQQF